MAQSGASAAAPRWSSPRPTTARCPRSSAPSSRTTSSAAACPASSPPAASSSASTWARSTWSSRSSRRPAWPAPSSASAAPATRSARSPAACCSPSTAATSPRPPSRSSGCAPAPSSRCGCRPTRSTCSPSRSSPPPPSTPGRSTTSTTSYAAARRSPTSPRSAFEATLDLLSGRYPSDEFAELRPRIVWDRVGGTITGRPGAQRLAVTSGGTIPDRGLFGVFLVGEGTGRRVGELDEEMVYESRVGDVFALGATSWRIEDITHDRVLVTPGAWRPGPAAVLEGRHPRPPRRARRGDRRLHPRAGRAAPRRRPPPGRREAGLDEWAAGNLVTYVHEQVEATRLLPSDTTLLVERFRDELGDWRLVVHSPYGTPVHAPWALAINARLRERYGVDGQAMASDDGIVIRIPDTDVDPPSGEVVVFEPDEIDQLVTDEVGGSALFAARFRECAARALLLPRRDPGRRSPAVAAAAARRAAARGRRQVPVLPDRPRGRPRVPPGRLRPARPRRPDAPPRPARGQRHRHRDPDARRPTPARSSSATSPSSSTRATHRSPSAAPPRCRSTRACWPSCSAAPSCASCSTPRCSPRSRPSSSGSRPTARPRTSRASPTCCDCSDR